MWGSIEDLKVVSLNGKNFYVGENLWNALRNLRFHRKPRTLWVDALCINQENMLERNQQVQNMSGILSESAESSCVPG
jgi:hypothetical protein